jgi:hypothetical protein
MLENFVPYLQMTTTLLVAGYMLMDWTRLLYRTHKKQKERPGLLELNWSLPGTLQSAKKELEEDFPLRISPPANSAEKEN